MTPTSAPQGAREEDTPSARRRLTSRVPIWVRVSVITGVVLVGVLLSTMLLAAGGVGDRDDSGGGHGSGGEMEMDSDDSSGGHGSGGEMETDSDDSSGGHGSGGETEMETDSDGSSGGHGSGGDRGSGGGHSSGDEAE